MNLIKTIVGVVETLTFVGIFLLILGHPEFIDKLITWIRTNAEGPITIAKSNP